ncbi:MAG: hypothetical protein GYA14_14160 [Ignavibacteria bacterium]|nr:hypothetical protein [Ignavibacteria bacterium]
MKKDIKIEQILKLLEESEKVSVVAKTLNCSRSNIYKRLKSVNQSVNQDCQPVNQPVNQDKSASGKENIESVNQVSTKCQPSVNQVVNQNEGLNRIENLEKSVLELKEIVEEIKNEFINIYIYNNKEKKITTKKTNNTTKNNIPECSINNSLSNNISLKDNKKEIKETNNKTNSYFLLVKNFANLIGVSPDKGFINKNIKHAKNLLSQYTEEEIFDIIKWRLDNDKDGFYHKKLTNLGFVYSHIAEWIKLKNDKKMTFNEFVKQNPDLDFENEDDVVIKFEKYFKIFKLAKNNPSVELTQDDWDRYKRAIKNYGKIFKKIKEGYYDEENY